MISHWYTRLEGKRSQNQRARAASRNDEGNASDDDDRTKRHFGLVLPDPPNRVINARELQRLRLLLILLFAFHILLAAFPGAILVIPFVPFRVRPWQSTGVPTLIEALDMLC